jgi:CPA2 family monovalent cation:H+ antiporter-2
VGYLLAGVVLGGPGSVDVLSLEDNIKAIAELGVSLLLFSLGLEFSWSHFRRMGAKILLTGVLQVAVTALAVCAVCLGVGLSVRESLAVGAMVALSSTACCLRILVERAELDSVHGRSAFAILLVQDLAVVPLAVLMAALGGTGTPTEIIVEAGKTLLVGAALVAGLYLVLNKIGVWALGRLTLERNRELTVLLAVATGLGSAWAAHSVGLSPALGAFGAGLFLGGSPFATQIRADVATLRIVLLTVFFGAAGMMADPRWIVAHVPLVLGVTAAVIFGKTLVVWLISLAFGMSSGVGIATGICLAQVGEFAFVLGSMGVDRGVVADKTYMLIVSTAIVTLLCTTFLVPAAQRTGQLVQRILRPRGPIVPPGTPDVPHIQPDVVIIGFGPSGQHVASALMGRGLTVHVNDLNRKARSAIQDCGFRAYIGDATQQEVLEHMHVSRARLAIVTIPDRSTALTIVSQLRRLAPQAHVVVRCRHDRHHADFAAAGAHDIVREELEAGRGLTRSVRQQLTDMDEESAHNAT